MSPGHISSLFLFCNQMSVITAGIERMQVRIENREDPDQKQQSDLGLRCLSKPFRQATLVFKILEHLP